MIADSVLWLWDTISGDRCHLQVSADDTAVVWSGDGTKPWQMPVRGARYGFGITGGGGITGLPDGDSTIEWVTDTSLWDYADGMDRTLVFVVYAPVGVDPIGFLKSAAATEDDGRNFTLARDASGALVFGVPNAAGDGWQWATIADASGGGYFGGSVRVQQVASPAKTVVTFQSAMGGDPVVVEFADTEKSGAVTETDATVVAGLGVYDDEGTPTDASLGLHNTGAMVCLAGCLDGSDGWADAADFFGVDTEDGGMRWLGYYDLTFAYQNKLTVRPLALADRYMVDVTPHRHSAGISGGFYHMETPSGGVAAWAPAGGATSVADALGSMMDSKYVSSILCNRFREIEFGTIIESTNPAQSYTPGIWIPLDCSALPNDAHAINFRARIRHGGTFAYLSYPAGTGAAIQDVPGVAFGGTYAGGAMGVYPLHDQNRDGDPADFPGGFRTPSCFHSWIDQGAGVNASTLAVANNEPSVISMGGPLSYNTPKQCGWIHSYPYDGAVDYDSNTEDSLANPSIRFALPGDLKSPSFGVMMSMHSSVATATARAVPDGAQVGAEVRIYGFEVDVFYRTPAVATLNFGSPYLPVAQSCQGSLYTSDSGVLDVINSGVDAAVSVGLIATFWKIPANGSVVCELQDDASGWGLHLDGDGRLYVWAHYDATNYGLWKCDDPIEIGKRYHIVVSLAVYGDGLVRPTFLIRAIDDGPLSLSDECPFTEAVYETDGGFAAMPGVVAVTPVFSVNDCNVSGSIFSSNTDLTDAVDGTWSGSPNENSGALSIGFLGISVGTTKTQNAVGSVSSIYWNIYLRPTDEADAYLDLIDYDESASSVVWSVGAPTNASTQPDVLPTVAEIDAIPTALPDIEASALYLCNGYGDQKGGADLVVTAAGASVPLKLASVLDELGALGQVSRGTIRLAEKADDPKTLTVPDAGAALVTAYNAGKASWVILGFSKRTANQDHSVLEVYASARYSNQAGLFEFRRTNVATTPPFAIGLTFVKSPNTLTSYAMDHGESFGHDNGDVALVMIQVEPDSADPAMDGAQFPYDITLTARTPRTLGHFKMYGTNGGVSPSPAPAAIDLDTAANLNVGNNEGGASLSASGLDIGLIAWGVRDVGYGFTPEEAHAVLARVSAFAPKGGGGFRPMILINPDDLEDNL